jgi:hypothetical protein
MKSEDWIFATLITSTLATGCTRSNVSEESLSPSDTNSLSITQQLENAKEIATNAWQTTKEVTTNVMANMEEATTNEWTDFKESLQPSTDYGYDRKDAFVAGASADVDAVDQKMKELSDRIANAGDAVKTNLQAKIQDLEAKRVDLGKKLDDVKNSTEANWNDVKTGFKSAYDELTESIKRAWQSL